MKSLSRDADLEEVYASAGRVTPAGVQRLIDSLQLYRSQVRAAIDQVDAESVRSQDTTSIYRLKDHIAAMSLILSELQFHLDLDHVDLGELTDGCQGDGAYHA